MPMAHSELPGMFNFEELHKGWFPHVFHTRENLSYRGPMPAKDYFKPQAMMPKKRKELIPGMLLKWRETKNTTFERIKQVLSLRCHGPKSSL